MIAFIFTNFLKNINLVCVIPSENLLECKGGPLVFIEPLTISVKFVAGSNICINKNRSMCSFVTLSVRS